MNITGIILMKRKGLPIIKDTFIFKNIKEISSLYLEKHGDERVWALGGFDTRTKLNDTPYKIKSLYILGFPRNELLKNFEDMNKKLDKLGISTKDRIFLICRGFYDDEVEFSGHAYFEDDTILIDIAKRNRPSGRDWTPDLAFKIKVVNNQPLVESSEFKESLTKICKDILNLGNKAYLDFTKLKEGYLFYHDLSIHSEAIKQANP